MIGLVKIFWRCYHNIVIVTALLQIIQLGFNCGLETHGQAAK